MGVLHTSLCPGLSERPGAVSQRHFSPSAKLSCFLHLWPYGVTKLSLGEHGTALLRQGPSHSHMSVLTRLQEGAWDVLWPLKLTICHEDSTCASVVSLLKGCLSVPQIRKKMLGSSIILDSERKQVPSRKGSLPKLCVQHWTLANSFYPILLGPVPGTGDTQAQIRPLKSFNSQRERSPKGTETNIRNSWYYSKLQAVNAGTLLKIKLFRLMTGTDVKKLFIKESWEGKKRVSLALEPKFLLNRII